MMKKKSNKVRIRQRGALARKPYASNTELNGPSRPDDQFERPTSESNPPQRFRQGLKTEEVEYE